MPLGKSQGIRNAIEEFARRVIRVGAVESVASGGRVRVAFPDQGEDGLRTWEFQVLHHRAGADAFYWMPEVGEHVVCLTLPYGSSEGFVVGSYYGSPPVSSTSKAHVEWSDGTWIQYDKSSRKLRIQCMGDVIIESGTKILLRAPLVRGAPVLERDASHPIEDKNA